MKRHSIVAALLASGAALAFGGEDALDRIDDSLAFDSPGHELRLRVSGAMEVTGYSFQGQSAGLVYSDHGALVAPRLTLFLDAQLGGQVYVFAQARADDGFDPGDNGSRVRADEYAVRFTPWSSGVFNLQAGKFATVAGNWVQRHYAWDNPFVTAPLPYENLTGIFDAAPAGSTDTLLRWSGVRPVPYEVEEQFQKLRLPIIWGPSYASGVALTGLAGLFDYAIEIKNGALASRPSTWEAGQSQWRNPTWTAHLAFHPDERWNLGISASEGSYLQSSAQSLLPAGHSLRDYREEVVAEDLSFAWHHFQFWAEAFETRFTIPGVGDAGTVAYYLEAKYKFSPQFFGAVRWNQQVYGDIPDGAAGNVRWGRDLWRIDLAPTYRFTPRIQGKLQYSLSHGASDDRAYSNFGAVQVMVRF